MVHQFLQGHNRRISSEANMIKRRPILFWQTLDWKTYFKYFFRNDKERFLRLLKKNLKTDQLLLTSSGRAAIMVSMRAAGVGRIDEIFMPPYLSTCVLESMFAVGIPSVRFTEHTKAILLYHHWGFPQNFSAVKEALRGRNVLIIEDCAHGFWGKTSGIGMGEFGDAAVYSLSKIFDMTYAGALRINNSSFSEPIVRELNYNRTLREFCESIRGEWTYVNFYSKDADIRDLPDHCIDLKKWYATLLAYPACKGIRGKLPRNSEEMKEIFRKQNSSFLFLLENFKNRSFLLEGDCLAEMAPLCYPVFCDQESILVKVNDWLREAGIYTGIYHFDINRNMFKPNYKRCIPIPLHASIDMTLYEAFIKRFKGLIQ